MDTAAFFPTGRQPIPAEAATACARCTVRDECLREGLRNETAGVWGGIRLDTPTGATPIEPLAALPAILALLRRTSEPMSAPVVAMALGLQPQTARANLYRLVDAGLVGYQPRNNPRAGVFWALTDDEIAETEWLESA